MSSRQLRKIQQQRELQQLQEGKLPGDDASDDEDDEPVAPAPKPRVSLFAALGGDDDDGDGDDDDEHDEKSTGVTKDESEPETGPQPAKKSKKKKKKKGKKKAEQPQEVADEVDEMDEIDRALQELSAAAKDTAGSGDLARSSRDVDELLQINTFHLKAIHEMRALFGKEAIESAQQEEQAEHEAELRRQRGQGPQNIGLEQALRGDPRRKLPEISLRRNIFIQGKENWPMASAGGLTMKQVRQGPDGQTTEFAFHHDAAYDRSQIVFFQVVGMGDPMTMVSLLRETPYHITTLLQVSKVATQDQNASLAADLCERALFTFGRVTTSAFRQKLEQGKARLDFRRPENREFWLAGYHYLKSLMRKGTYRTALEWAKLLYSLNPNDPYAVKNFLHPLAIRARQAQWLVDFCGDASHVGREAADDRYLAQTVVLARLQLGDAEGARAAAVEGMETLPWLYSALFQALNLDVPPPLWGVSARGHQQYWTDIYLHQARDLWNNAAATALLQEAVKLASKADVGGLPADGPSDLRTARFAFLEGDTKLIAGIPRHVLAQEPNYEFDPLPPPLAENIFSSEGVRLPWRENEGRGSAALETPAGREFAQRLQRRMARAQALGVGGGGAGLALGAGVLGGDGDGEEEMDLAAFGPGAEAQQFMDFAETHDLSGDDSEGDPDERLYRAGVGAFPDDDDEGAEGAGGGVLQRLMESMMGGLWGRQHGEDTSGDAPAATAQEEEEEAAGGGTGGGAGTGGGGERPA